MDRFAGVTASILGGVGGAQASKSAEPERDVLARLPCFAIRRREDAKMDEVVLMLKVL